MSTASNHTTADTHESPPSSSFDNVDPSKLSAGKQIYLRTLSSKAPISRSQARVLWKVCSFLNTPILNI